MTHIGIEFGSNEIRAVRLSRDHTHVEAFVNRPLNAPPSTFVFSETLRSTLADLGLTPQDPVAIAVAIGRSGSGISSDSGISDFLDELGNRLGEPLIQVADRLGRVAYAPAPSLALVQGAFAATGFAVESIELPPVAAARLVPDGSPGVLRLHSGVDWAARIVGGQLVEALAAPIREATNGVLWHPTAGTSQLITDFPVGCDLPGRDRAAAGVAIGAAIGLSRSTRPLQLNREPLGVEEAIRSLATTGPASVETSSQFQSGSSVGGVRSVTAAAAPAVIDDIAEVVSYDRAIPNSLTRTGRRAAGKSATDSIPAALPPVARADRSTVAVEPTDESMYAGDAAPTPAPRIEDTAAAEEMIARARSRAKESEAPDAGPLPDADDADGVDLPVDNAADGAPSGPTPKAKASKKGKKGRKAKAKERRAAASKAKGSPAKEQDAEDSPAKEPKTKELQAKEPKTAKEPKQAKEPKTKEPNTKKSTVKEPKTKEPQAKEPQAKEPKTAPSKTGGPKPSEVTAEEAPGKRAQVQSPADTEQTSTEQTNTALASTARADAAGAAPPGPATPARAPDAAAVADADADAATVVESDPGNAVDLGDAAAPPAPVTATDAQPVTAVEPPAPAPPPPGPKRERPRGTAPLGRIGQRSPKRPLFDIPPLNDKAPAPAQVPAAEPAIPAPAALVEDTDPVVKTDPAPSKPAPAAKPQAPAQATQPATGKPKSIDDERQSVASSSLTQRLRDDQSQERPSEAKPKERPDANRADRPRNKKRSEKSPAADASAESIEADAKDREVEPPSKRPHLSVARAEPDTPLSTDDGDSGDDELLDNASPDDEFFDDEFLDDESPVEDLFARDVLGDDAADQAGFGAAIADDSYIDDDEYDDFESSEFDSGDLAIDEILAEGRRREASYETAAPRPPRAGEVLTIEELETQRALKAEREREEATAVRLAEQPSDPTTPAPDTAAAATTIAPAETFAPESPFEASTRVPGAFQAQTTEARASVEALRALPQPRQDDRVRPPEAAAATAAAATQERGLPLPLMALFAVLSVTALVLVVIGFDDPPERTAATDTTQTTVAPTAVVESESESTTAAAPESVDDAEVTEGTGTTEVEAVASPTDIPRPAVGLEDLGPQQVSIADGVITLEGPLPNQEVLDLFAERAAEAVGAANVVNNMVVHPDAPQPENGNVRVESAVVFTTGGTEIPNQYAATINQTVAIMQRFAEVTLVVEGHSDSDGTPEQNIRFSENRANAIVAWLAASGISPDRMSIVGYGDARPVASNETDEGKAANRRVDLEYVNLLSG